MTMTIDEKYDNAVQLFCGYYDGENETLHITSSVLEDNGFGEDFWSMLCPRLRRGGILKEWPFLRSFTYVNQERADAIQKDLQLLWEARNERETRTGIFSSPYKDKAAMRLLDHISELEKKEPELQKELDSLPKIYTFIVDGEKLVAAYKKQQVKDSTPDQSGQSKKTRQKNRLNFYPDSGDMEFGGEIGNAKSGDKDYALLTLLHRSKNTPFSIDDIREKCNPLVVNPAHKFKGEKDISDTVRQIRFKLKVNKGSFFPISKTMHTGHKSWVLIDK
jgi:hypothetical protein